jgi:hypothetical protein
MRSQQHFFRTQQRAQRSVTSFAGRGLDTLPGIGMHGDADGLEIDSERASCITTVLGPAGGFRLQAVIDM